MAYSMSWSDPDDSTAENRQAWQRFSGAWAKRDIDGLMALVTDDVVYGASVGPEPGATFRGRDEVRRGFETHAAPRSGAPRVRRPGGDRWRSRIRRVDLRRAVGRRERWMRARDRRLGVR